MNIVLLTTLIAVIPLLSAMLIGLMNRHLSKKWALNIAVWSVFIVFILSLLVLKALVFDDQTSQNFNLYHWGSSGELNISIGFLVDRLSALMTVVVSFVSWMVHIYTLGYMREDPGIRRFYSYILLFTFGMLVLVLSNNFLQLFFGWEIVGLMSYLLIGFWFERESANQASLKAFLVNRVGDFGFILGIAAVLFFFGSLDYQTVFEKINSLADSKRNILLFSDFSISIFTLTCFLLFIGAMGKSAQIPLHVWLPDSMEGPTPISALIHAATMVTAGVFMIARLSPLFEQSDQVLNFILIIGAVTAFAMGMLAIVQNDIKRIIAYSTLSQLGYMMVAMGASAYALGIFHLTTHAFYKALLFLGAGACIMVMHHEQNIWKMANLKSVLPITYWTMLIGSLALVGFPFFSGFYSKDLIIEAVKHSDLPASGLAYVLVLISVFITAVYTFRLLFVVFVREDKSISSAIQHIREPSFVIKFPLLGLALPAAVAGLILVNVFLNDYFLNSLSVLPQHESLQFLRAEFPGSIAMGLKGFLGLPFILTLAGIFLAWLLYLKYRELPNRIIDRFKILYRILREKYGFDYFYSEILVKGFKNLGWFFWQFSDNKFIDGVMVDGSAKAVSKVSYILKRIQTGLLYQYAFAMVLGFLILIFWLVLWD